ncbi:hypothetical protein FA15DRAFT_680742 [Coprinopsis marcescibilis]|uniref:Uncharacterized protein n=1 Tax=Coprinopsis marcescibilis TaxID=230819 RepID=A0A5C3KUT2_COPMA|nr:hypothetical protein FA15DRAFT_680742 [Coprinopsis marcescibilis]
MRWVLPCIVIIPLAFTFLISHITTAHTSIYPDIGNTDARLERLERARRRRIVQQELKERQRRFALRPFPFHKLPAELRVMIIENCAEWPDAFSALVRVSKPMQVLAYQALLPLLPIRIIDAHHVVSFDYFLEQKPSLAGLVHHLWMTPLHEDYYSMAVRILRRCTNIVSLACAGRMLQDGVTSAFRGYQIQHTQCHQLTLLYTSEKEWFNLLVSPSVNQFFRQLTHLRLVGKRTPRTVSFPKLAQISFAFNNTTHMDVNSEANSFNVASDVLKDQGKYPELRSVALVRERTYLGNTGVRIWKNPTNARVFVFEIPKQRTELELWCDNALGKGFWQLCRV